MGLTPASLLQQLKHVRTASFRLNTLEVPSFMSSTTTKQLASLRSILSGLEEASRLSSIVSHRLLILNPCAGNKSYSRARFKGRKKKGTTRERKYVVCAFQRHLTRRLICLAKLAELLDCPICTYPLVDPFTYVWPLSVPPLALLSDHPLQPRALRTRCLLHLPSQVVHRSPPTALHRTRYGQRLQGRPHPPEFVPHLPHSLQ